MAAPETLTPKQDAIAVIGKLPDDATWADIQEAMEIRRQLERGLADSRAGRTVSNEEVRRRYGLA